MNTIFFSRRLLIFIGLTAVIPSCDDRQQKEPFASLLKNCDEVNIKFYNGGDSVNFDTQDSLGIKVLSESVTGNETTINDSCQPAGEVFYRANGDTLFRAEFAVLPDSNENTCDYISYSYQGKSYKNRLHSKAYQLLTQIYPKPPTDTMPPVDSLPSADSTD